MIQCILQTNELQTNELYELKSFMMSEEERQEDFLLFYLVHWTNLTRLNYLQVCPSASNMILSSDI